MIPSLRILLFPWPYLVRSLVDPLLGRAREPLYRTLLPLALTVGAVWMHTVPVHELLHAAGCLLGGGEVSELEIKPVYGGALLARLFAFVRSGGNYQGRLAGFDTGGNDWCYLLTDALPYLLTILLGVPMLELARRRGSMVALGVGMVHTILPVASLGGDYYEMGSVVATRMAGLQPRSPEALLLRGDDLALVLRRVEAGGVEHGLILIGAGVLIGVFFLWLTMDLSILAARLLATQPSAPPGGTTAGRPRTRTGTEPSAPAAGGNGSCAPSSSDHGRRG